MPLEELALVGCAGVTDLSVLRGMPLRIFGVSGDVRDWTPLLARLSAAGGEIDATARADEPRKRPGDQDPRERHPRNARISLSVPGAASVMPKGRNFH